MSSNITHALQELSLLNIHPRHPGLARPISPPAHQLYSTRPHAGDRYSTPLDNVLAARAHLRSQLPQQLLRVAGVSFEGRQDTVASLTPGQALAFTREPENPYDPNAVAITTLDSQPVGYVPKDRTQAFMHSLCFGQVHSVGKSESGMWGCSAEVQPKLPPVVVRSTPANLTGRTYVAEALEGCIGWDEAKNKLLQQTGGRCSISFASTNSVAERWTFDDTNAVMKLVGFVSQSPEVTRVQCMLESGENLQEVLQAMNNWSSSDGDIYLGWALKVQGERSRVNWKVDLSLCRSMVLEIPLEFADIVV